jgi:AraC-like DNA-binding protein
VGTTAENQLADLGFQLLAPSLALRPYVKSFWVFRRAAALLAPREEYMHPVGGFGLVFNFGDSVCLDGQVVSDPLFLDGTTTISRAMGFRGRVEMLGIRFVEGGAYPILGLPLAELRNELSLLDALERPPLLRLHARLHEAPSTPARLQLLEAWLLDRLALGKARSPIIPESLALLRDSAGRQPIAQLVHELGISQRQLERLYQVQVGMSPRQYAQLLCVERARQALRRVPEPAMAALASELGFYDQSHFIREFRAVVGQTPGAYLRRVRK